MAAHLDQIRRLNPVSTPSWPGWMTTPASPRPPPPTIGSPGRRRRARSTGCPWPSRTPSRRSASPTPRARRSSGLHARRPTRCWSSASAASRRRPHRQDQRAGVRHGLAHLQHRLRHHPQPLRPHQERRRLERWRRGGARRRSRADRRWQRLRRLAAQPGQLQQRRCPASDRGTRADGAVDAPARRLRGEGRAGPVGRGRRVRPERGGGTPMPAIRARSRPIPPASPRPSTAT